MDEVDKIIIHSLKQIGCKLETDNNEVFGMSHFTPDLLARSVSRCLQEIKPDAVAVLPKSLPENMNMAQRFTIASTLAETCVSCGYRGDIGYQTFLYPNVVDTRRLFMFLIEQLPKLNDTLDASHGVERNEYNTLLKEIKQKISGELKAPWVPQYCRGLANRKADGSCSLTVDFLPHLNLHIPQGEGDLQYKEFYQAPNIFQQATAAECDLVSSVLHKSEIEMHNPDHSLDGIRLTGVGANNRADAEISALKTEDVVKSTGTETEDKVGTSPPTTLQNLIRNVNDLKQSNDSCIQELQTCNDKLNKIRQERASIIALMDNMRKDQKFHERTCVILENPQENVVKLEGLICKTRERRLAVEHQWQSHREPALKQIEELQKLRQSKNLHNIQELRQTIQDYETSLKDKTNVHAKLAEELKRCAIGIAPRKEYTRRIYEFIGNIRKQRNDIYKILDDTRDLQKQLNSVSAQLQRQFNYTDDLLFQSAKVHSHAKQAYKLLASLHASCNEICDLVSRTGQTTKEIRDLEVQIDREHMKNVAASLEKITGDIKQFEMIIESMQIQAHQEA
ncbi:coiled-coil domain-containing protein 22 homolog [Musca autumnalis]|uniref:coiled-coil domain-containing protein 22 homolog n=1 Tax=Musca autumnalis TaxID=221902 RepID=UPI003CEDE765